MDLWKKVKRNNVTIPSNSPISVSTARLEQKPDEYPYSRYDEKNRTEMVGYCIQSIGCVKEGLGCCQQSDIKKKPRGDEQTPLSGTEQEKQEKCKTESEEENRPVFICVDSRNQSVISEKEKNADLEYEYAPEKRCRSTPSYRVDQQNDGNHYEENRQNPFGQVLETAELPEQKPETAQDEEQSR
jgi:hypothetical protein